MRIQILVLLFALGSASLSLGSAPFSDDRVDRLPEKYRKWLEEEVTYIITDVEREAFLNLTGDEEREGFIDAFWRRRDTVPTTYENEFRDEHYKRLAYVNEYFGRETFRPGWKTDRGRYYIMLGPPRDIQSFDAQDEVYPAELWFYNNPELKQLGLPAFFYLLFFRRQGSGELQLYSPATDGPQALLTGMTDVSMDFRDDVERAYYKLFEVSPELAHASLSFRTDEGDIVNFQAPAFGTASLMGQIAVAPFRGVDTSYAERFDVEKGIVESDYLFRYVPSWSATNVLPGPEDTYYIHWVIEIDPQNISMVFDQDRGAYGTVFIVSAEVVSRDDPNKILVNLRKESFMNLSRSQAEPAMALPFAYSGMLPAAPGSYDVRIILRNRACPGRDESGCLKSYTLLESSVDVPVWDAAGPHLSEVVLGYGLEYPSDGSLYRPYRFGSVQLLANPRSVYAIGDSLVAMAEPMNTEPGSALRFRIVNREVPDQILTEKTVPVEGVRLGPLVQEFSLEGFNGGRYQLVVDLLGPDGTRLIDTEVVPFDVTPRNLVPRPSLRGSWLQVVPEIPGLVKLAVGEQYLNLENKEKARELFEAALTENPDLGPARVLLGRLLLEEGESEEVIGLLEHLTGEDRERYEVMSLLGEAYYRQKDYARAVESLERAMTLRGPDTHLLNTLAVCLYETGERQKALELLERSLSLVPDQPEIEALRKKIQSSQD